MILHRVAVRSFLAGLVSLVAACSDHHAVFGDPTEAACPPGSTLTYESFGQPFMESYCTRCHAADRMGEDRHGAPEFHDFDTLFGIKAVSDHIDETAAAGPASTNTGMPNDDGAKPTLEERKQLGEWIACGMPSTTTTLTTSP